MNTNSFGDWVQLQRRSRRMSQSALARALNMDRSHISKIESGVTKLPSAETRERFHALFGTSDEDLVESGVLDRLQFGSVVEYVLRDNLPNRTPVDHPLKSAEAPTPEHVPAHLRTSFAKAGQLSHAGQQELESFIDYLGLKEGKDWANTRRTASQPASIPEDYDPDDDTPISLDIPRS